MGGINAQYISLQDKVYDSFHNLGWKNPGVFRKKTPTHLGVLGFMVFLGGGGWGSFFFFFFFGGGGGVKILEFECTT